MHFKSHVLIVHDIRFSITKHQTKKSLSSSAVHHAYLSVDSNSFSLLKSGISRLFNLLSTIVKYTRMYSKEEAASKEIYETCEIKING